MRLTRRDFGTLTATGLAAAALPAVSQQAALAKSVKNTNRTHGSSLLGPLKYQADFPHFDYVNPAAPKGGTARLSSQSTFDSFNPFITKGTPPSGIGLIFDTLMTTPLDEGSTGYGLLAEWMEEAPDYSWVAFKLRPEARWHDGTPITPADVIFSFEALTTLGLPLYRFYYKNVSGVRDMGDGIVLFEFDVVGNRELPHIMGQLSLLPKHWWEARAFDESGLEPLLSSGPYRIGAFEVGRFIEYERVADYWGRDLPVNIGQHNFDRIRYEIFLDGEAAFEGFKSGVYDYRAENSASKWAEGYDFPAVQKGLVTKEEVTIAGPKRIQTFAMNLRRAKFQDRRVREAITLAFDFERTNQAVYFGQYARPSSYFQGSAMLMQSGAPEGAELALLEPLRGQVPDAVFGPAWTAPKTDGSGRNRRALRRAGALLAEAGNTIQNGTLMTPEGTPFTIEFLSAQDTQAKVINPFMKNLEQLGITASLRVVDGPQYIRRVAQDEGFDWDMIIWGIANSESPGNEQREYWHSETANRVGGRNVGGISDPAVDALIDKIIFAEDRPVLEAASRALDRVLLWNHYMIPQLYTPFERIAYWNAFSHPEPLPPRNIGFPTVWWWDAEKAAALEKAR